MEWTEEIVARLRELWKQGLSTAEIGRQLNVTKNAVVGKAHRLGLEARPSPIRRAAVKKDSPSQTVKKTDDAVVPKEKVKSQPVVAEKKKKELPLLDVAITQKIEEKPQEPQKVSEVSVAKHTEKSDVKPKKIKLDFISPAELPKRRSNSDCCWPIGDPGTKGFHFCGAQAIPGKPYCLEHVQVAYVKLRDRRNNVA